MFGSRHICHATLFTPWPKPACPGKQLSTQNIKKPPVSPQTSLASDLSRPHPSAASHHPAALLLHLCCCHAFSQTPRPCKQSTADATPVEKENKDYFGAVNVWLCKAFCLEANKDKYALYNRGTTLKKSLTILFNRIGCNTAALLYR